MTHTPKILSFSHVINIKIKEIFFIVFEIWSVFYTYSTSQLILATLQVLSHMWLGVTVSDSTDVEGATYNVIFRFAHVIKLLSIKHAKLKGTKLRKLSQDKYVRKNSKLPKICEI